MMGGVGAAFTWAQMTDGQEHNAVTGPSDVSALQ